MQPFDSTMRPDDWLWALGSLCRLARVPFDAALIAQRFPPPATVLSLREAAHALGFRTGERDLAAVAPRLLPFPCIALIKPATGTAPTQRSHPADRLHLHLVDASAPASDEDDVGSEPRAVLLLHFDGEKLICARADSDAPFSVPVAELATAFASPVILAAHEPADADGSADGFDVPTERPFGLHWFVPELLRHKRIWRDVLLASVAIQLVGLAAPLLTQVVIDKVIAHQTLSTLTVVAVALVLSMLFASALTWLRQLLVLHTGNRVDAVLGSRIFRHLLRLPLPFFEGRTTGVLVARLQGVETIRQFVSGAAVSLLLDLPFLLIFVAVMFFYSWELAFIALALLGLIAAASAAVVPPLRQRLNHQFLVGARAQSFVTEYVAGMATVKALQMEPTLERRYDDLLARSLSAGYSTRRLANTYSVAANALEQTMTLSVLIVGALLVMRNDGFTVGMLVAFQMFAARMSQPLLRLVGLWQEFQQASVAVARLGDLMDAPAEPYAVVPSRVTTGGTGRIEIAKLSFRYSPAHPYLYRNLNLTLAPGRLTVLTGASGCGKSTLAKLLLNFYQPVDGAIRLDGRDIRHLAANELRLAFGVVPQETVLFAGTVYNNLVLGQPAAGFEEVVAACRLAEIHDTIEKLPQGYQTPLGEHGVGLSGGQRQRLAIARALLRRPKVLIFDEAASNLDATTAEQFAQTVNKLKGKVTILFIAHHVPRGLRADDVVNLGQNTLDGMTMEDGIELTEIDAPS